MTLFLSKLQVRRDPSIQALGALIDPVAGGARMDAHHRLVWTAFAGDASATRDFLWRADGRGRFLVLSPRRPADTPFFEPAQTTEFAPDLRAGDRLGFALQANATRTRKTGRRTARGKEHKQHVDLVMDALPPRGEGRAAERMATAQEVAQTWLTGQGERGGFTPDRIAVEDYSVHRFDKGRGAASVTFGVLEMTGELRVNDPATLVATIARGIGRAKAFGCGLMLIRRT